MGGRGASSKNIPRMNNPAGIPSNAMTEDEFLALRGVPFAVSGYSIDKLRGNRQLKTTQGQNAFNNQAQVANDAYYQQRADARAEYKQLVKAGKIRDKTSLEKRLTTANGNPDNQSVQAARRLLDKQGIDYKTGKKKKSGS